MLPAGSFFVNAEACLLQAGAEIAKGFGLYRSMACSSVAPELCIVVVILSLVHVFTDQGEVGV